jgi:hypothetical protein
VAGRRSDVLRKGASLAVAVLLDKDVPMEKEPGAFLSSVPRKHKCCICSTVSRRPNSAGTMRASGGTVGHGANGPDSSIRGKTSPQGDGSTVRGKRFGNRSLPTVGTRESCTARPDYGVHPRPRVVFAT